MEEFMIMLAMIPGYLSGATAMTKDAVAIDKEIGGRNNPFYPRYFATLPVWVKRFLKLKKCEFPIFLCIHLWHATVFRLFGLLNLVCYPIICWGLGCPFEYYGLIFFSPLLFLFISSPNLIINSLLFKFKKSPKNKK